MSRTEMSKCGRGLGGGREDIKGKILPLGACPTFSEILGLYPRSIL